MLFKKIKFHVNIGYLFFFSYRNELEQFDKGLSVRPHAIVANKIDKPEAQVSFVALSFHISYCSFIIFLVCASYFRFALSLSMCEVSCEEDTLRA